MTDKIRKRERTFAQMKRSIPINSLVEEITERLAYRGWGQCAVAEMCFVRSKDTITDTDKIVERLVKRGYSPEIAAKLIEEGKNIVDDAKRLKGTLRRIDSLALERKGAKTR